MVQSFTIGKIQYKKLLRQKPKPTSCYPQCLRKQTNKLPTVSNSPKMPNFLFKNSQQKIQGPKTPSLGTKILSQPTFGPLSLFIRLAKRVKKINITKTKIALKITIKSFKKALSQPLKSIYQILENSKRRRIESGWTKT